jgi:hypothetical protein
MKTRLHFVNYLKHLQIKHDSSIPDDKEEKKEEKLDAFSNILERARHCVKESSQKKSPEILLDVFNGFPLDEKPAPYDHIKMTELAAVYDTLLTKGDTMVYSIRLQKDIPWHCIIYDKENNKFIFPAGKETEIKNFIYELFLISCDEILDGQRKIRKEIVEVLRLQPMLASASERTRSAIITALVISFFKKILLAAVYRTWKLSQLVNFPKLYPRTKLLEKYIDSNIENGSHRMIRTHMSNFPLFGRPLAVSCGLIIAELPIAKIQALIAEDLRDLSSRQWELIPDMLKTDWRKAKILFWKEVMEAAVESLDQQRDIKIQHIDALQGFEKDAMLNISQGRQFLLDGDKIRTEYNRKAREIREVISKAITPPPVSATLFSFSLLKAPPVTHPEALPVTTLKSEPVLLKYFNARDNDITIQSILSEVIRKQLDVNYSKLVGVKMADYVTRKRDYLKLYPESKDYLKVLERIRFNSTRIGIESRALFAELTRSCPYGRLYGILTKYDIFFQHYSNEGSSQLPQDVFSSNVSVKNG